MSPKAACPIALRLYGAPTLMSAVNLAIQVARRTGRNVAFRFHDRMHRVEPVDTHHTAQSRAAVVAGLGDRSAPF